LERRKPRPFRIPLVPANQRAELSRTRVEGAKTEITRSEIELLVVKGIVGDVHFAIEPAKGAVAIKDCRCVVVDARRTFFEQGSDQYDAVTPGRGRQFFGAWPWNGLGQIEQRVIFALTEVLGLKQLRQADNSRAASSRVGNTAQGLFEILF